jgi:hypothetical protein
VPVLLFNGHEIHGRTLKNKRLNGPYLWGIVGKNLKLATETHGIKLPYRIISVCFRGNNIYLYQGEVVSVALNQGQ